MFINAAPEEKLRQNIVYDRNCTPLLMVLDMLWLIIELPCPVLLRHICGTWQQWVNYMYLNLWCVSSWWPLFPSRSSVLIYICILYMSSVIGRIYTNNRNVIQCWRNCTPSHSIGIYFCEVRGSWVECHFLFFFGLPIVSSSLIKNLLLGCLWPLVFVLNNILILAILCSAISQLPGCFAPGPSFWISASTWCLRTPLCHI